MQWNYLNLWPTYLKFSLFDDHCNKCDLEFVAWVCLKIHDNLMQTRTVINVISNYSSLNVISSYSSLNNFEEGRESKISSAKVNKIRESKIFLYDISMVKYDLSYVIYDNKYRFTTLQNILLEGENNSTRTWTVIYVISNLCPECISRHVDMSTRTPTVMNVLCFSPYGLNWTQKLDGWVW